MSRELQCINGKTLVDDWFIPPKGCLKVTHEGYAQVAVYSHKRNRVSIRKYIRLHRLIIEAKQGEIVDHINGNRLDNRRCNLRIVKPYESSLNRRASYSSVSGVSGVTRCPRTGRWIAGITANGKRIAIGRYSILEEAVFARSLAEKSLFGEFSRSAHAQAERA